MNRPHRQPLLILGLLVWLCGSARADENSRYTDLFNGRDLSGWVAPGDGAWGVRNGELVTLKPGQGGWIRTERMYRDFDLTLEFWMPQGGNSGVGLRSSSGGDPAFTGFEVQILDTHGEEPGLRNCGAIYEAVEPAAMAVHPSGQWNSYRIRLVGDVLDVWLNGVRIHEATRLDDRGFFREPSAPLPLNARATTGYIAIQDHGHPFRYRNIRIKDLSADPEPEGMRHLITAMGQGGVPDGWFATDAGEWTIEQGALVGRGGPGHLFTMGLYTDFEMRALVRTNERGNSGMYFRVVPNPDPGNPWPLGYEAQVDHHDPRNFTGCVYNAAWSSNIAVPFTRDDAWFDYRVRVEGERVRTWINGIPMVDAFLTEHDRGHLAVQGHHDTNVVMYRDIRVLPLD
ncbi:MAG: DUF1080 domain-containing protein [Planctomycetota bacterium]